MHRLAIVGMSLWIISCGTSGKPLSDSTAEAKQVTDASSVTDVDSCYGLTLRALDTLTRAELSVSQCTIGSDCKAVPIPADCLSACVRVVGNDEVRNAVASTADALGDICMQFRKNGCTVTEGGCPLVSNLYDCQMSRCIPQQ